MYKPVAVKKKTGRKQIYNEPTVVLSVKVPVSKYDKLKTILEYELDKFKNK